MDAFLVRSAGRRAIGVVAYPRRPEDTDIEENAGEGVQRKRRTTMPTQKMQMWKETLQPENSGAETVQPIHDDDEAHEAHLREGAYAVRDMAGQLNDVVRRLRARLRDLESRALATQVPGRARGVEARGKTLAPSARLAGSRGSRTRGSEEVEMAGGRRAGGLQPYRHRGQLAAGIKSKYGGAAEGATDPDRL